MLSYAVTFLIDALVAAVLDFRGAMVGVVGALGAVVIGITFSFALAISAPSNFDVSLVLEK